MERLAAPGDESGPALEYDYQIERDKLLVKPAAPLQKDENLLLLIECFCVPSDHILEGVYKDVTPGRRAPAVHEPVSAVGLPAGLAHL